MKNMKKKMEVGSAWLLAVMAAMVAALISFPTPAQAQNLPGACSTVRQSVVVHLEHDAPLRMVATAIWEGMDPTQATAYLNGEGCGVPAPRALNTLAGRHGTGGMSLRATAETRADLFQSNSVEGVRFLSMSSVVCHTQNAGVFEAHYRRMREVPADAGVTAEADGAVETDAGFIREEERGDLTIDCARVRANEDTPRRWFRERVPHGSVIYIGARSGRDITLPRGGIARPTEAACDALAVLVNNPSDDEELIRLRRALEDPEPVETSVRAFAVRRVTNIAIDLARRLRNPPSGPATDGAEVVRLRSEVRSLRADNGALRGELRGTRRTIDTLKELPMWLGIAIGVLIIAFIIFASWAFGSNDRLAKVVRRQRDALANAEDAGSYGKGFEEGRKSVFVFAARNSVVELPSSGLPVLVRQTDVDAIVGDAQQRVWDHYERTTLPGLRDEYAAKTAEAVVSARTDEREQAEADVMAALKAAHDGAPYPTDVGEFANRVYGFFSAKLAEVAETWRARSETALAEAKRLHALEIERVRAAVAGNTSPGVGSTADMSISTTAYVGLVGLAQEVLAQLPAGHPLTAIANPSHPEFGGNALAAFGAYRKTAQEIFEGLKRDNTALEEERLTICEMISQMLQRIDMSIGQENPSFAEDDEEATVVGRRSLKPISAALSLATHLTGRLEDLILKRRAPPTRPTIPGGTDVVPRSATEPSPPSVEFGPNGQYSSRGDK